jgi:hypothetical protein
MPGMRGIRCVLLAAAIGACGKDSATGGEVLDGTGRCLVPRDAFLQPPDRLCPADVATGYENHRATVGLAFCDGGVAIDICQGSVSVSFYDPTGRLHSCSYAGATFLGGFVRGHGTTHCGGHGQVLQSSEPFVPCTDPATLPHCDAPDASSDVH